MEKKIVCLLAFLCCYVFCAAQQVVSSGGYAKNSEVTVNWILGGSLSDIPAVGINSLNRIPKELAAEPSSLIKVYPVPAIDFINIEIAPTDTGRINLELYSSSGGKILSQMCPYQPLIRLNLSNCPSGIYYLKLSRHSADNPLSTVEKIIKN